MSPIRVTVWNEGVHETRDASVQKLYPEGMHTAIAEGIKENLGDDVVVRTAVLADPEHGLTEEVLADTDVLTWWGHAAHDEVDDAVVQRVHDAVLGGMGLVVLHSGHYSKIFKRLLGTSCSLRWRNEGERELVFVSSFAGGEVFRGGCCFRRGRGRIFYFSPGDQDYPVYHHPDVQRVIANAVRWAAPGEGRHPVPDAPQSPRGWFE